MRPCVLEGETFHWTENGLMLDTTIFILPLHAYTGYIPLPRLEVRIKVSAFWVGGLIRCMLTLNWGKHPIPE